ncbi:hypothetical protein B7N16_23820 [Salmonella enterica subsp. enterica serovar Bovismorbificans]|uniref:Uncharacterized protein n=1 Tax=Salmonella enterica subsp. enterica serovar Bovismorbificans TaxID=58097 RepID=A0A630VJR1_SALET|nr:hypothetical protein [Salmonella enterica subsp. enterica serovar Bovismorbificans]EEJ1748545.1 hypothetical protein [Salmonella enterica subsp. enterica]ECW6763876.1 hypothetical protein [Salmonella enterica subsp. enterica serovar Bovismorbificans]ECW6873860.1 hypothetical protein [Salmonella enterica subsp. enterica serovar Bovismorbificans]ECW6965047.1 hypothetical protein [Salmonella enterica subsp. enterica serovar Bovismorbificans]
MQHRGDSGGSETGIFRIFREKERNRDRLYICLASAYVWHTHIFIICICCIYTYVKHLPILNICTHPVQ